MRGHVPPGELALHSLQRGAYDFFERVQVAAEFDAGLEPRHIEKIAYQAAEPSASSAMLSSNS